MLHVYTIYHVTDRYPIHYLILRQIVKRGGEIIFDFNYIFKSEDLEKCREEMMKKGLTRVPKDESDAENIVESWI